MATTSLIGEDFLRDIIRAAAIDVASIIVPGSSVVAVILGHLALALKDRSWEWMNKRSRQEQMLTLNSASSVQVTRARTIAEEETISIGVVIPDRGAIINFLSVVPMTIRRAISHPADKGIPTTLLSHLPQNSEDMLRFLPIRTPNFQPGDTIPGYDYRIDRLLGLGGFAEVWKANSISEATNPSVALKFCLDQKLVASLETESKIFEILKHHRHPDDYVQLLDTAQDNDPPFLVYEYVDGGDLTSWILGFDNKEIPTRDVVRVMKMCARGLAFAHKNGIVHRDLKPANVLFARDGRIKIADFGIGALTADAQTQKDVDRYITNATILHGAFSPLYADPLQPRETANNPTVDVYAMGVMMYQLLLGDVKRPLHADWRADLQDNVPDSLIKIIAACVARPQQRLQDAGELLSMLSKLPSSEKVHIKTTEPEVAPQKYCTNCGKVLSPDYRFCINCGFSTTAK